MKRVLLWHRNDLRLEDHEPLAKALQRAEEVVPVYCIDQRWFRPTSLGFCKMGNQRTQFLMESVEDLDRAYRQVGGHLIVNCGIPEEVIPVLAKQYQVQAVYASKEVTEEETQVEARLEIALWKQKISLELFWTSTLYHLDDLPFPVSTLPDVFTDFRKAVERTTRIRCTVPAPSHIPVPEALKSLPPFDRKALGLEPYAQPLAGGARAALKRIQEYIWEKDLLRTYKETRNGLLGSDYASRLSPWLSLGCISPRQVYEQIRRYERERIQNDSTYWLIFELIWRDYFRFVAKKYGNRIFQPTGIQNRQGYKWQENLALFEKWKEGQTGIPFVDANMRELKETGFMSNRGRQNVASFLAKDLNLNWTWGAIWFESQLIDYDVCSNWGNWNYVAGVGNDPRENRYFNILSQATRYDPQGEYVKYWLPELEGIPSRKVHLPSELSLAEQQQFRTILGSHYPHPVINPKKWLKEA
jgi:deoxyribodipyrimidine photo-lyase